VPARVLPDQDVLVCDTISALQSNTLLVATAEQNYGQIAARIRQPFDFAARTGKIVFGRDARSPTGCSAGSRSPSPRIRSARELPEGPERGRTADPAQRARAPLQPELPGRGSGLGQHDHRHHQLHAPNHPGVGQRAALRRDDAGPPQPRRGRPLDRHVAIYASPASTDGVTFAPVEKLAEHDIALPFTSGYVQLSVYNHASVKYSTNNSIDAYVARFDNVGFDGPVLPADVAPRCRTR